ncbi:MAG TPA: hypothetical protein VGN68_13230 [Sphingopyxis sp.]|uniref:hypothetical protein n=1 Tax=Sphingopyxis sp. TaxID=1908224 RepID=UPI002E1602AD|nr:hypothetical protein [Sphingopyxis sp.]
MKPEIPCVTHGVQKFHLLIDPINMSATSLASIKIERNEGHRKGEPRRNDKRYGLSENRDQEDQHEDFRGVKKALMMLDRKATHYSISPRSRRS